MNFCRGKFEYIPFDLYNRYCDEYQVKKIYMVPYVDVVTNLTYFGTQEDMELGTMFEIMEEYISYPYFIPRENIEPAAQILILARNRLGEMLHTIETIDIEYGYDILINSIEETFNELKCNVEQVKELSEEELESKGFTIQPKEEDEAVTYATFEKVESLVIPEPLLTPLIKEEKQIYCVLKELGVIDYIRENWSYRQGGDDVDLKDAQTVFAKLLGVICQIPDSDNFRTYIRKDYLMGNVMSDKMQLKVNQKLHELNIVKKII